MGTFTQLILATARVSCRHGAMGTFAQLLILAYLGAGHSSLDPRPSAEWRSANTVNESPQSRDLEEPEMAPPEDELTNQGCKTCTWGSPLNAHDKNNALTLDLLKAHTSPANMSAAALAMQNGLIDSNPEVQKNFKPRIANAKLTKRWPSGEVPYTIENTFNDTHRAVIQAGINDITAKTCVSFREKVESDLDWMEILSTGADGCSASAAFYGPGHGAHSVKLKLDGCVHKSIVIHELLHILSVSHEQQRPDRDEYVDMHWMNMQVCKTTNMWRFAGMDEDLDKLDKCELDVENGTLVKEPKDFSNCVSPNTKVDDFGVPYDYTSVMHYSLKAFALNYGQNVMTPKNGYTGQIGGDIMSAADITRLQRAYSCKETEPYDYNGCGGFRYSATGGDMDGSQATGCEWILKTDPEKGITINFSQVSFTGDCSTDYIVVRGGSSDQGPFIGEFCESNLPPTSFATRHNAIYVKYVKNSSGSSSWKGTWTAAAMTCCAKVVYEKSSVGGTYSRVDGAAYHGFPVYKHDDKDKYMVACPKFSRWVIAGGNYASVESCPSNYNKNEDGGAYCPQDALGSWLIFDGTPIVGSKVRCSDCQLYPQEPECATCCDKVVLEGLGSQTSFNGLYEKQDTLVGGRPVYKQDGNYYLVFGGDGWYGKKSLQAGSNIKNEDEVYCPGKISSPWLAYTGAWTPQQNSNTRCSDCTLYPAQNECVECCSKVILSSSNPSFTNTHLPFKPSGDAHASWTATGEQANGKIVYKNDAFSDYCLWTSPCGQWATNVCTLVPDTNKCSSYLWSSEKSKCPHSVAWSGGIQVKCGESCSGDPPAAPSGAASNWDSSTKLGGTIVTYTCDTGNEVKAICDAGSMAWKPASIQCKAETAAPTSAPTPAPTPAKTTTKPVPETTKKPVPKTTKSPGPKTTKKPVPKTTKSPGGKKPGPKPGKKPGKPGPKPGKPGKKPGKPSKKPVKPSKKPGALKPSKKPAKPAKKPGESKPSKKPGKPSKKPGETKPAKKPGKPSKKPGSLKPSKKPGKPSKKPGETKPAKKPSKKPEKPSKKPVKPSKKPGKPKPVKKPGQGGKKKKKGKNGR